MNLLKIDFAGRLITLVTLAIAIVWAFPLYWAVITTLKPEFEVAQPGLNLLPKTWTLGAYTHVLTTTKIGQWYVNSVVVAVSVTVVVVMMGALCGYALSQLRFRGRTALWFTVLASFMVPIQALIVTHFVLMSQLGLINSWLGIVLPQLIVPVVVIVYKQFFDSVPKDFREAARVDGANEFDIFFRIYLPMNWGVTTALAIITFIGAWNAFLWPFLVSTADDTMTVTVGITMVKENFGVQYARNLAAAVLAALPVAIAYLVFQRRVTQAIMLSAGIKG
jgi:multiple sugar transport system permease protein